VGGGSVFRIYLPVSAEVVPVSPQKTAELTELKGTGTILVVDDDILVRNMAKLMLTRLGYSVLEAKDGVEAVEVFQQHPSSIRCVLSDLTMPRMNGWETLEALRSLSPNIPVILSSGYDEAQVMAEDHPERPNAFLGKPYQIKGLGGIVSRVLAAVDR
jgi:CheY-like chemotaxis protein